MMLDQEEEFIEAYKNWKLEQLYADLQNCLGKSLSPNAKIFLKGVLCGYQPKEIAEKLNYQGKDPSVTVRQTLSKEVYPAIKLLPNLEIEKIDFNIIPSLLSEKYQISIKAEMTIDINWKNICQEILTQQNEWLSHSVLGKRQIKDIYVPLELIENQEPPRINPDIPAERGSEFYQNQEIKTPISNQDFFDNVIKEGKTKKSQGKRIAIIGEPGAGKTTLLQQIADQIPDLPIWIDLADDNLKKYDDLENFLGKEWLKRYLPIIRQYIPDIVEVTEELETSFKELFYQRQICLLLDGLDELSKELGNGNPVNWLIDQMKSGFISQARIIVTCRLNVWDINKDQLYNKFDIYCNRDFDYPEQVEKFIDNWFKEESEKESKENLKAELKHSSQRIQDLIKNPLRLMLICKTWKNNGDKLPDTKAGIYQRLVDAIYELKESNPDFDFIYLKEELNKKLGELAKEAINKQEFPFRLRESLIKDFLGDPKQKPSTNNQPSLFWVAKKLGFLNQVGLPKKDESDADENVYAFFHATFQEYFAALAIDDNWQFFLNHVPENPDKGTYRIFEPKWKEVFLSWLGIESIDSNYKNNLILEVIQFHNTLTGEYGFFYQFKVILILAESTNEFRSCHYIDQIINRIIEINLNNKLIAFGSFIDDFIDKIHDSLLKCNRTEVLDQLLQELLSSQNNNEKRYILYILRDIGVNNSKVINTLEKLLTDKPDDSLIIDIAATLGTVDINNNNAIHILLNYFNKFDQDIKFLKKIINILGDIGKNNRKIIDFLETLLKINKYQEKEIVVDIAESLAKIDNNNIEAINTLIKNLISKDDVDIINSVFRQNYVQNNNAINQIIKIINNETNDYIIGSTIWTLGLIAVGHKNVFDKIINLMPKYKNKPNIYWQMIFSICYMNPDHHETRKKLIDFLLNSQDNNVLLGIIARIHIFQLSYMDEIFDILKQVFDRVDDESLKITIIWQIGTSKKYQLAAIEYLINVIQTSNNEKIKYCQAVTCLAKIDPGNRTAFDTLISGLNNPNNKLGQYTYSSSLSNILQNDLFRLAVIKLRNNKNMVSCEVLWHCAQNMSYPEFYQAWHFDVDNNPQIQALEKQLNNLSDILQKLKPTENNYPIIINLKPLEKETDTTAISQEFCNQIYSQIFPKEEIPEVKNAPQLKRLFPKIKSNLNTPNITLILIENDPYSELETFCRKLTNELKLIWITDQPIDPPLKGVPEQKNLLQFLQNWLNEN